MKTLSSFNDYSENKSTDLEMKIRVTGSGTKADIANALLKLSEEIKTYDLSKSVEWEDSTLVTEIQAIN